MDMEIKDIPTTEEEVVEFLIPFVGKGYAKSYIVAMSCREGHHSIGHVLFMLRLLKTVPVNMIGNLKCLTIAILFHDICYIPGSKYNEAESVREMKKFLSKDEFKSICSYAGTLIEDSVVGDVIDPTSQIGMDTLLLHDLDYAVLGADWQTYLEYMMGIWSEYGKEYGMSEYVKGRIAFLSGLLTKSRPVFFLSYFCDLEKKAFENIRKEIAILEGRFSLGE